MARIAYPKVNRTVEIRRNVANGRKQKAGQMQSNTTARISGTATIVTGTLSGTYRFTET